MLLPITFSSCVDIASANAVEDSIRSFPKLPLMLLVSGWTPRKCMHRQPKTLGLVAMTKSLPKRTGSASSPAPSCQEDLVEARGIFSLLMYTLPSIRGVSNQKISHSPCLEPCLRARLARAQQSGTDTVAPAEMTMPIRFPNFPFCWVPSWAWLSHLQPNRRGQCSCDGPD